MANDIVDINVYETVETVDIIVQPNLTTVNITQINAGNGSVPVGGTVGQVLAKIDSANFNTQWVNQSGGGGGGATNLGYTPSATNGIVTSDTGTDATIPLADGTNAGLLKPAKFTVLENTSGTNTGDNATNSQYSGLATSKQDTLGFTPYNATNPSGYQTAGQVQTIADAKVVQTITNGVTATAPSQDAVFDALALKQDTLTEVNFGTFVNSLTAKNTLVDADEVTSDDSADSSKAKKTSWGNVWALFLKPKTDFFYQPLRAILTNTTASFTTADETKLDALPSDFNSATRAQTEAELVAGTNITITPSGSGATRQLTIASSGGGGGGSQSAFTVLANNTNASAVPTEQPFKSVAQQAYTGTIVVTATTQPTGATNHSYTFTQVGKLVSLRINIDFATSGTVVSSIACELPSDCPTPELPTAVSASGDVIVYGTGTLVAGRAIVGTMGVVALRLKSISPNVFEVVANRTGATFNKAYYSIQYLTA